MICIYFLILTIILKYFEKLYPKNLHSTGRHSTMLRVGREIGYPHMET